MRPLTELPRPYQWRYLGQPAQVRHAVNVEHHLQVTACGEVADSYLRWCGETRQEAFVLQWLPSCPRCLKVVGDA